MNLRSRVFWGLFSSAVLISSYSLAADKMLFPTAGPLIVPNYLATKEFFQSSATFSAALRSQQVYGASEFPNSPILITGIYWRPAPSDGFAFPKTVLNIKVNLSTTSKQPDGLSSVFAENVGSDDQVVFDGPLKLSSNFQNATGGTKKFDMFVRLQHPFYYDPSQGNLLLDIHNFQASKASTVDAYGATGDGGSRVIALDPNATSADFTDTAVDPIRITFKHARAKKTLLAHDSKVTEPLKIPAKSASGLVALSPSSPR